MKKPACKLIGTDGNAFSIIGKVSRALKKAGLEERAKEFASKAMDQSSYDDLLILVHDYVEVE